MINAVDESTRQPPTSNFELKGKALWTGQTLLASICVPGANGKKKIVVFFICKPAKSANANIDLLRPIVAITGSPQNIEFGAVTKQFAAYNQQSAELGPLYDDTYKAVIEKGRQRAQPVLIPLTAAKWELPETSL